MCALSEKVMPRVAGRKDGAGKKALLRREQRPCPCGWLLSCRGGTISCGAAERILPQRGRKRSVAEGIVPEGYRYAALVARSRQDKPRPSLTPGTDCSSWSRGRALRSGLMRDGDARRPWRRSTSSRGSIRADTHTHTRARAWREPSLRNRAAADSLRRPWSSRGDGHAVVAVGAHGGVRFLGCG